MKFKLPRQIASEELYEMISKEVLRQKLKLLKASQVQLQEIAEVSRVIAKQGIANNLVCKKLPDGLGSGIFLHPKAQPILKGQMIAPYAGEMFFAPQNLIDGFAYGFEVLSEILLTKEEQLRFDGKRPYHPRRFYSVYVDAFRKGNFTRFINHSKKPNLVADLFSVPHNSYGVEPSPIEVIYLAKKKIQPGEQLLVSYEGDDNSYWSAMKIKPVAITPQTFQLDASFKVVKSSEIGE